MQKLTEGDVAIMRRCSGGTVTEIAHINYLDWLAGTENVVHLISMVDRHGLSAFVTRVEDSLYPANTEKETAIRACVAKWRGFAWMVITVPAEDEGKIKAIASEMGMEFFSSKPVLVDENDQFEFPMNAPQIRTVMGLGGADASIIIPGIEAITFHSDDTEQE